MQLTGRPSLTGIGIAVGPRWTRVWTLAAIISGLVFVFVLDRATASAPVQHLYYLPIILASLRISRRAGLLTATAAIVLYHAANPTISAFGYKESDLVQIALFLAVGIVTARLSEDARRLHRLATTDDLTGLHNLRSFEPRLIAMVGTCRQTGAPLSVLVLDVDRLKSMNDTYGHLAGAEAVRTVGHVLATRLPPNAVACRYGGDEFVVAIPECSQFQAHTIADELRDAIRKTAPVLAGTSFPPETLSISVGLACLNAERGTRTGRSHANDVQTAEALFREADRALYVAKEGGRNRVGVA
jgi:diguanylate cyclase (GGDEF)-like protein